MKTIEEAAKEYELYSMNNLSGAFKAGVEFAQRWIPVEEELPEIQEPVHVKGYVVDIKRNEVITYDVASTFLDENNKKLFFTARIGLIVTHWRQIELK